MKDSDRVELVVPPPRELLVKPEEIPLEIVFQDDDIIVVNKPPGLVVHPAPGHYCGTLVNALLSCGPLASLGGPLRPGIVHRLDKDTSGLLVAARNDAAYLSLVRQFKDRTVKKVYLALVHGVIKNNEGTIDARIGRHPVQRKKMAVLSNARSRTAVTTYRVVKRFPKYTLLEVVIKTGRTHQIRVHLSHLGYPIVGDATYGRKKEEFAAAGQLLHAYKLEFTHPRSGQIVSFESKIPAELKRVLDLLS